MESISHFFFLFCHLLLAFFPPNTVNFNKLLIASNLIKGSKWDFIEKNNHKNAFNVRRQDYPQSYFFIDGSIYLATSRGINEISIVNHIYDLV